MVNFANTIAEFSRFSEQQGYPSTLLWALPDGVLIWRRRFLVLATDPEAQILQAKAVFNFASARNVGIAIEGKCRTSTLTICWLYVPKNDIEAQCLMIPETGVKMSVAIDPPPVTLIKSNFLWRILKTLNRRCKLGRSMSYA
jgi:hypothetical protein